MKIILLSINNHILSCLWVSFSDDKLIFMVLSQLKTFLYSWKLNQQNLKLYHNIRKREKNLIHIPL